ncbi:HIT domain-containing protein [Rickettsia endosymbiont of Halotydeus destructor]|uniref:HIT domain-containing protein n=1 Tax=Rickettsia endosymbiont of Halotydeus destructor TaxID=2996754 RepID=UPI003BB137F2
MYDKKNIFAKIINKDIPAEIIYEDDRLLAFKDINPVAPVHLIVIPKQEYIDYADFIAKSPSGEIKYFSAKIADIAKEAGLNEYRLITNKGESVGQSIFHFHFHIIGGKKISGLIG